MVLFTNREFRGLLVVMILHPCIILIVNELVGGPALNVEGIQREQNIGWGKMLNPPLLAASNENLTQGA